LGGGRTGTTFGLLTMKTKERQTKMRKSEKMRNKNNLMKNLQENNKNYLMNNVELQKNKKNGIVGLQRFKT
jgi:hypothetical protein